MANRSACPIFSQVLRFQAPNLCLQLYNALPSNTSCLVSITPNLTCTRCFWLLESDVKARALMAAAALCPADPTVAVAFSEELLTAPLSDAALPPLRRLLAVMARHQGPRAPLPLRRAAHRAALTLTAAACGAPALLAAGLDAVQREASLQLRCAPCPLGLQHGLAKAIQGLPQVSHERR